MQEEGQTAKKPFVSKYTKGYRFEVPRIDYLITNERITGRAGVGSMVDLFANSKQYDRLRECLPTRNSNSSYDSVQYALSLLTGFWLGADCLDDIEKYRKDEFLVKKLGGVPTARSLGNWLRDFDEEHLGQMQDFLSAQASSTAST